MCRTLHVTVNCLNNSEQSVDPECERGFASNFANDTEEESCMGLYVYINAIVS